MTKSFAVVLVISCLWLGVSAQVTQEPRKLEPSRPLERAIAGSQSHIYRIELGAGQFVRLILVRPTSPEIRLCAENSCIPWNHCNARVMIVVPQQTFTTSDP
jgi:hypothetical protein